MIETHSRLAKTVLAYLLSACVIGIITGTLGAWMLFQAYHSGENFFTSYNTTPLQWIAGLSVWWGAFSAFFFIGFLVISLPLTYLISKRFKSHSLTQIIPSTIPFIVLFAWFIFSGAEPEGYLYFLVCACFNAGIFWLIRRPDLDDKLQTQTVKPL